MDLKKGTRELTQNQCFSFACLKKRFYGCQVDVVVVSACLIPFAGVWRCYLSTGHERDSTGQRKATPIAF